MNPLATLLQNNREWSDGIRVRDPKFFCPAVAAAGTRVSLDWLFGQPCAGQYHCRARTRRTVRHRNLANLVKFVDMNCLSVIQFAVDVLRVRHVIVCGHYDCGGVHSVLSGHRLGLSDNWLGQIRDIRKHEQLLAAQQQKSPKIGPVV